MRRAGNGQGSTLSNPPVQRFTHRLVVVPLTAWAATACTASMPPGARTETGLSSNVEDEFAFVVNPMAHVVPAAAPDPEPTVVYQERPAREQLSRSPGVDGPARPTMEGVALDYAAIPLATEAVSTSSRFTLSKRTISPTCAASHEPRVRDEWWLTGNLGAQSQIRVDGFALPPVAMLAKGRFEDTNDELSRLSEPRLSSAEWTSVELPVDGDAMTVTTFTGSFDAATLVGVARRAHSVEAKAIVPRELYAFRVCEEGCLLPLGDPARVERLAIVGPPAVWLGSGGSITEARVDGDQPFTLLATRVWRGGSASLMIDYTLESAKRAQNETVSRADALGLPFDVSSVMVDVVWAEGDAAPSLILYRGRFPRAVASQTFKRSSAADDDCYQRPRYEPNPTIYFR